MPHRPDGSLGFTLLEVVVILAILALVTGIAAPLAFRLFQETQIRAAQEALPTFYRAIVGDQRQTFGFYGDVGDYPASLVDLVRPPVDAQGNLLPGWRGPYLTTTPDQTQGGQLTDPFGQSFEYYLVDNVRNLPDRLAIISKGPDGTSTSTSPSPNAFTTFTGTAPTDNTYLNQSGNSDNLIFPPLDSANNDTLLRVSTIGSFAPTILNFDSSSAVNAFVPACPSLFTITLTSVSRGAADVRSHAFMPGMVIDMPQGAWQVRITMPLASSVVFSQVITVLPNATLTPTINFTGLNSQATPKFTLTLINQFASTDLDVVVSGSFGAKLGTVNRLKTGTFAINACIPVQLIDHQTGQIVDQFTMPFGNDTEIQGTPPEQLTVSNDTQKPEVKIFVNRVQIGQVNRKRQKTFTVNQGDTVTITDKSGTVLQTFTMPGSDLTVTV